MVQSRWTIIFGGASKLDATQSTPPFTSALCHLVRHLSLVLQDYMIVGMTKPDLCIKSQ